MLSACVSVDAVSSSFLRGNLMLETINCLSAAFSFTVARNVLT